MYNVNRIVTLVANLENSGSTQAEICETLNKKGYMTATGKKWNVPNLGFFKSRYAAGATKETANKAVSRKAPKVALNPANDVLANPSTSALVFIGAVLNDRYLNSDKKINVINAYIG